MAKRKQGLTIRALDGEALVYDPETTRASCLNEFAAAVLERCDGNRSPDEIARDLPFENVDPRIVVLALADLQKAQLLEADAAVDPMAPTDPSRRALMRRLGVGSAMAVPMVTAIVLPSPAEALSAGDTCQIVGGVDPCPNGTMCQPRNPNNQAENPCENVGDDCICR